MEYRLLFIFFLLSVQLLHSRPLMKPQYFLHAENFIKGTLNQRVTSEDLKKDINNEIAEILPPQPSLEVKHVIGDDDDDDELSTLYYWFALHDSNDDGKLDGYELLQAFAQWGSDQEDHLLHGNLNSILHSMKQMVDSTLVEDDRNRDGMIDIDEFLISQHY